MAIVPMAKILIVSHNSEAAGLLEVLQREGICQILNAQQATVSKDLPELAAKGDRPKDIEELLNRLTKCIAFLKGFGDPTKALVNMLSPRVLVDEISYQTTVSDQQLLKIVDRCEQLEAAIEKAKSRRESLRGTIQELLPWQSLATPVEEIGPLARTICQAGMMPAGQLKYVQDNISELGGAIQQIAETENRCACLVVYLKENTNEVQKLLRAAEFAPVNFAAMLALSEAEETGTAAELIKQHEDKLSEQELLLQKHIDSATKLSKDLLKLEILHDHYANLLSREQTKGAAPATQRTVVLEGWVKEKDYRRLEKIVSGFEASSLSRVKPAEDEEIPVEIENKQIVRPFEVITRLYGMPQPSNVDPTIFLAPFFALFFGICLGDAGYGLIMVAATVLLVKKMQGDKKLLWMLGACSVFAILVGVLTGSWFGNAVTAFVPSLEPLRKRLMWFDPLEKPLMMLGVVLILGYVQLMSGLVIAFVHNLRMKDYAAGVFEQLTWLVMLNSLLLLGLSKAGVISADVGKLFGRLAVVPAVLIVLLSSRQGGWGGRLGLGAYNLFSAVFYLGDVLSYLRLMALGMVSSGLAMAVNLIAGLTLKIPYGIGILVMILVLIGGHGFNLILSVLGAFVHTMRLQFVEFFPKFLVGGGRAFQPLCKEYKHIYMT
jgi:V/A-type H+-transporting ATPase subunit I